MAFSSLVIQITILRYPYFSKLNALRKSNLFHPVSNFNTLRHQFESGKTQKTAGRRLSVAIGNTKVTIAITIIQV
jgi:hypothetical protein